MVYTMTTIKASVATMISGTASDADLTIIINRAARSVVSDIDMHSHIRRSALSPGLFDDVYNYSAPSDLKMSGIIDIRPQINRSRFDEWRITTTDEFDRLKSEKENTCAISEHEMTKSIKISRQIDDTSEVIDSVTSVDDWAAYGDGTNLTSDSSDFIKGSASVNWDINADGGTTAGIYNSSLTAFDVSDYLTSGSIFVWVYISNTTYLTNFIIRVGSSSTVYYSITVTTNNEGTAFETGWNLLRFDFDDKVTTGTVDDDACDYVALYMTKNALKVSETDFRFNYLVMKIGERYNIIYYSKYAWQDTDGTYLENSTDDTDYINADTEEIGMIESKSAELCERHLRNHKEASDNNHIYMIQKNNYLLRNPSEAMVITTTYHFT